MRKNLEEDALELKSLSNKQNHLVTEQRKNMDFLIINKLLNSKREKNTIKNNIFPKKNHANRTTAHDETFEENLNETIVKSQNYLLKNEENEQVLPSLEPVSDNNFNKSKIQKNMPKKNVVKNSKEHISKQNETVSIPQISENNNKEKKTRFKEKPEKNEKKPNNDLEKERNSNKLLETNDLMDFYSE